jgi:membrane protein implicated in regulation of membrane protease activity
MSLFYLFATIFAGLLLGGTVLLGPHHFGGHDVDQDGSTTSSLLSPRLWIYFLFFGGVTGLLLPPLAGTSSVLTAVLAGVAGASSATLATAIFRLSARSPSGTVRNDDLTGRSATVLVPAAAGAAGTVRLTVAGRTVDLVASCDEGALAIGQEVLIVSIKDGRARVALASAQNPTRPNSETERIPS